MYIIIWNASFDETLNKSFCDPKLKYTMLAKIEWWLKEKKNTFKKHKITDDSRTSRKRPGGCLREVVAYEKLVNIGSKYCLISIW